jgi:amino acid permease
VVKFFMTRGDEAAYDSASHGATNNDFSLTLGVADAMTTIGLAFAYHYNVPAFYKEMHQRSSRKFLTTAAISQPIIFLCYLCTGVFGFLLFGSAVDSKHSGGNIVKNFSDDDAAVNVGRFGLFFHFCCVYPILAVACRRGLHSIYVRHCQHGPASASDVPVIRSDTDSGVHANANSVQPNLSVFATKPAANEASLRVVIVEAFGIVSTSIALAWIAPGINIVVNITGCLFGILFMFIVPGILGARLYRDRLAKGGGRDHDVTHYRCSLFVAGFGIFFTVASFIGIIKDMADGNS